MPETLTLHQLREIIYDGSEVIARRFQILASVASLAADAVENESAANVQELILRLMEFRESLADCRPILDELIRQHGLFPYLLNSGNLGLREQLAIALHRPENMEDFGFVFHGPQAMVFNHIMQGKSVVLSAPTSFGKSLILDAIVASQQFQNILIVVPTIALIDETRRRLSRYDFGYKLITHTSQAMSDRNIFVLTQERVLEMENLDFIDFFVIDEFYKLALDRDEDRSALLNQAFYKLIKVCQRFYMLGPHIQGLTTGLIERLNCEFIEQRYQTVVSDIHIVECAKHRDSDYEALTEICSMLDGPTLIFCSSPNRAAMVARKLIASGVGKYRHDLQPCIDWLAEKYHPDWHLIAALRNGIGLHHGRVPRALSQHMVRLFDQRKIDILICTSTLIEGVNTKAQNMIIFDDSIMKQKYDFFTFSNIRGRSGRMCEHFVGHVYVFNKIPENSLPIVDIPVLTQPAKTPEKLLIQLDHEDLSEESKRRIEPYFKQNVLPMEILKANVGIDLEGQISLANKILANPLEYHEKLYWTGYPTWRQLLFACEIIWTNFDTRRFAQSSSVTSYRQLAFLINKLRSAKSIRHLIECEISEKKEPDEAVSSILDFIRLWAMFHFPRLLRAIDRIQHFIFKREKMSFGDYNFFASKVENLFLDSTIIALDEYGVPIELSRKFEHRLSGNGNIDISLALLKSLNLQMLELSPFERELLIDAQTHLSKEI